MDAHSWYGSTASGIAVFVRQYVVFSTLCEDWISNRRKISQLIRLILKVDWFDYYENGHGSMIRLMRRYCTLNPDREEKRSALTRWKRKMLVQINGFDGRRSPYHTYQLGLLLRFNSGAPNTCKEDAKVLGIAVASGHGHSLSPGLVCLLLDFSWNAVHVPSLTAKSVSLGSCSDHLDRC